MANNTIKLTPGIGWGKTLFALTEQHWLVEQAAAQAKLDMMDYLAFAMGTCRIRIGAGILPSLPTTQTTELLAAAGRRFDLLPEHGRFAVGST
jgi:hypothetical protein